MRNKLVHSACVKAVTGSGKACGWYVGLYTICIQCVLRGGYKSRVYPSVIPIAVRNLYTAVLAKITGVFAEFYPFSTGPTISTIRHI